ncbi:signal peptide containing protein [Theileria equi strain WA]|uniref:Signal peptide containing protein n=1 Tax=Theileria equi strain WA TaxID=1537102 RepID=L1LAN5_THEEQ|nr:signal peptide containing protein [Theileria equi strain WA]EKX72218.1 signal peptide containing protein [Theileria equi strain WA]|eukprot:XP_004831670.1 signal peptide containing protein [Theileria equi strain WA]
MNVLLLISVVYVSRLCGCTGGGSKEEVQDIDPGYEQDVNDVVSAFTAHIVKAKGSLDDAGSALRAAKAMLDAYIKFSNENQDQKPDMEKIREAFSEVIKVLDATVTFSWALKVFQDALGTLPETFVSALVTLQGQEENVKNTLEKAKGSTLGISGLDVLNMLKIGSNAESTCEDSEESSDSITTIF